MFSLQLLRVMLCAHESEQLNALVSYLFIPAIILPLTLASFGDTVQQFQLFHLGRSVQCLVNICLYHLPHTYRIRIGTGELSVSAETQRCCWRISILRRHSVTGLRRLFWSHERIR